LPARAFGCRGSSLKTSGSRKKVVHISKVTGIHGMEKHLLTLLPGLSAETYEVIFLILVSIPPNIKSNAVNFIKSNIYY
jgi:hypothetical protein